MMQLSAFVRLTGEMKSPFRLFAVALVLNSEKIIS